MLLITLFAKEFIQLVNCFILDVTNYASFAALVQQIDEIVKEEGLNVLINNAGIYPSVASLNSVTDDELRRILETNSIAPVMVTKVGCLRRHE